MSAGRQSGARRVLVAQAYFLCFDSKVSEAGQPMPPLGSLVCAAVLRERGFDVRFFDSMLAASEEECAVAMDKEEPEVLVLFEDSFNYLTKMCLGRMRQAATRMIAMARERGISVIVAGSDASDDPRSYLDAGARAVAVGEGELAVAEWLRAPGSAGAIPGIVSLGEGGGLEAGPARIPVRDADSLPSPAWDLIDVDAYRRVWRRRHRTLSLPLATSRGCPFHCNWCAKPIWGQRYAALSPARAAREVESLKRLGAEHVNIVDDIFGLRPGWMEGFADELERLDAVLPFRCLSRADLLTDRMVAALARAGCRRVWIGAESGSQRILDAMEKGTTVGEIRAAADRLKSAGIEVCFFLQFGYPGETEADVASTWELVETVLPDDIGISVSYPLQGARFFDRVKDEMQRATHWYDSNDLAMLFRGQHATPYYRTLHAYTHARFRLARALGERQGNPPTRLLQALRYGTKRAAMAVALWVASRDRLQVRPLPPELSREHAATPGPVL